MQQQYAPLSNQVEVNCSNIARRLLWHLHALGTIYLVQADQHEAFEKPGAHLFWVVGGQGTLETQNQQYSLTSGNKAWLVDMMHRRTYTPLPKQRLTLRGIRFGGLLLEDWHEQLCGGGRVEFLLEDMSVLRRAYWEIWKQVKLKSAGWEWEIHLTLDRLLGVLLATRKFLLPAHANVFPPVARVLAAIAAGPLKDWKARDLAKVAGTSYSNLRRLFLQVQKETLHRYIQRNRLQRAKMLLANPDLSIKDVAETVCFSSECYFSRLFKKWAGMSPSEFRKQPGTSTRAAIVKT